MISKQKISSNAAIFGLIILLLFLADIKYKQWKNQRDIEKEKANIQAQADSLQKKNEELNQSLQYLNSPSFKERVARQQLNLKKEGETIYSFADPPPALAGNSEPEPGNPKKWLNYFFSVQ